MEDIDDIWGIDGTYACFHKNPVYTYVGVKILPGNVSCDAGDLSGAYMIPMGKLGQNDGYDNFSQQNTSDVNGGYGVKDVVFMNQVPDEHTVCACPFVSDLSTLQNVPINYMNLFTGRKTWLSELVELNTINQPLFRRSG